MKHLLLFLCFPCLLQAQYIEPNSSAPYNPPTWLSRMEEPGLLPSDHYLVYVKTWETDHRQWDTVSIFEYVRQQGRLHFFGVTNLRKDPSYKQANMTFTYDANRTLAEVRYDMHFPGQPATTTRSIDSLHYGSNGASSCTYYSCDSLGNPQSSPTVNDIYMYDEEGRFTGMTRDYPNIPNMGQKYIVEMFTAGGKPLILYSYSPHDLSLKVTKNVYDYDDQNRLVRNSCYMGKDFDSVVSERRLYYSHSRMYPDSAMTMSRWGSSEYRRTSFVRYTYSSNNTIARIHIEQYDLNNNVEFATVYSYVDIPEKGVAAADPITTDIRIYPNPLDGDLLFVQGVSGSFDYIVYDIMGRFIAQGRSDNGAIPLAGLKTGTYLLTLNGKKPVRLIKE